MVRAHGSECRTPPQVRLKPPSHQSKERVMPEGNASPPFVRRLFPDYRILEESWICCPQWPHRHRRSEEKRDASIIDHVHHALHHYNDKNPGSEFDPVKPLMAAYVGFRSSIWVHVSFLARRRNISSSKRRRNKVNPVEQFFAELRYSFATRSQTVETCTIIDKSSRHLKTSCAFCPKSFEILHPLGGKFVCGKKIQAKDGRGFVHFTNRLEKPFTCPKGELKNEPPPEQDHGIMGWILCPFHLFRNFLVGFLWGFDAKLKAWITYLAS